MTKEKTTARISDVQTDTVTRRVRLKGMSPIMFDRYAGDNQTKLEWHQKIYMLPGSDRLYLLTTNIVSFLSAHNTNSAPKRLRDARAYKKIANACLSFVMIQAMGENKEYIPFLRNGSPIEIGKIGEERDETSGLYMVRHVARLEKGIPNPKERPVLPLPWELEFELSIFPNREIKEQEIMNLIIEGGVAIGLGTFRGIYGKFTVDCWE